MGHSLKGHALVFALAVLIVSCTAGGTTSRGQGGIVVTAPQGGSVVCPLTVSVAPPLYAVGGSPSNGATGVPVNVGTLYFAVIGPPSSQVMVQLTTAAGTIVDGGDLVYSPVPLPTATGQGGSIYQASAPTLASGTTYTVYLVPTGSCPVYSGSSGSFTTQ
jgi:hypothetical protein